MLVYKKTNSYLKNLYSNIKYPGFLEFIEIHHNWKIIFSGEFAEYTKPLKILFKKTYNKDGILYISVKQYYIFEFKQFEKQCIKAINIYFIRNVINEICIIASL